VTFVINFLKRYFIFYRSLTGSLQTPKVIVQYLDQLDAIPTDSDISGCEDDSEDDETWLPRVNRIVPHSDDDDDAQGDLAVPVDGGGDGETSCSQILKTLDSSQSLLSLWAVLEMTVAHEEKEYLSGCDLKKNFLHQCRTIQNLLNTFFVYLLFFLLVYILIRRDYTFLILLTQTSVTCTMQTVL
jgi:hypothetical protein